VIYITDAAFRPRLQKGARIGRGPHSSPAQRSPQADDGIAMIAVYPFRQCLSSQLSAFSYQ